MALIIEQRFQLGRFHATRWNQNPFEDRHGEWPPSPWRLLRALAARWFQYSRETGDEDATKRDDLLQRLASEVPTFVLPPSTWRGEPAPRQYHKTEVGWTDASAKAAAVRKPKSTLTVDHFRAVAPEEGVLWRWSSLDLTAEQRSLLNALLTRTLYFGRAEAWCTFRVTDDTPVVASCELSATDRTGSPVLVPDPNVPLNIDLLLASTDDAAFKGRQIPPGTQWFYARLPRVPPTKAKPKLPNKRPHPVQLIQFAVGGRVYPPLAQWVRVTERFRGTVLRHATRIVTDGAVQFFSDLWKKGDEKHRAWRDEIKLLSGKDGEGKPLKDHQHSFFGLWPDENGQPTRLIVWRVTPFNPIEVRAILNASDEELSWRFPNRLTSQAEANSRDEWRVRLVPLPTEVAPLPGMIGSRIESTCWESLVPFVPPNRNRFRSGGRLRATETATALLRSGVDEWLKLRGINATINRIEVLNDSVTSAPSQNSDPEATDWVITHETANQRAARLEQRQRRVRPAYRYRITFSKPVHAPICVGHSVHFGLGLFVPQ
ncbi:MAG: type I-U CRISPR-associated protein Csb2 [Planctomycetaceae bacterium]